ncbi:hypothetical protein DOTSEDRAFT_70930 [Dothistroma septosporum NZE10]|uniref:Uncharacterized protein n=1 Tax=Dothistroma septosporum (strain NZE10 / CBS 128990) TaxID=675120 RepID=N1PNR2_DOTSN|nr:hypothetical protein DOTSEDRAFT_70930 [Dothistroma septosporum NZE10]
MPQAGLSGSQTVQQSKQHEAVRGFVSGSLNLETALEKFCAPVEKGWKSSKDAEEVEEHLSLSWQSLVAAAATTSFTEASQQKLVDFVMTLQERSVLEKDGQVCQVQGMTVWDDLPTFGWKIRDAWNLTPDEGSDQSSKDQWINLNAFAASLVASAHSQTADTPDLTLFGLWTIRSALEESHKVPDVALAAAAAWFVFAAPTLADLCREEKSFEGKVAKPGSAHSDQDWTGYSMARWESWKQKLDQQENSVSDSTAKQLMEQAVEAVSEVKQ